MNPFDRARLQAAQARQSLLGSAPSNRTTSLVMLDPDLVEDQLEVSILRVPYGSPVLGNNCGTLVRRLSSAYVRNDVSAEDAAYLIAHELGHWFLDAEKPEITYSKLSSLTHSQGSVATVAVESYGARERQELQANVFARELLLPREVARSLWAEGFRAREIAAALIVPLEVVRLQLFDALLLPNQDPLPAPALPVMTPDQASAAFAPERFVNVVAGPGSGKTTTLIHRIKHLIERGVPPSKILVLTFTNKAAAELVERMKASDIGGSADVWAGTFHAFGLEFVRKYHQLFTLSHEIRITDLLMQVRMMVRALPRIRLQYYLRLQDPYDWLPTVLKLIQRLKEELVSPSNYRLRLAALPACEPDVTKQREDIASIYEAYEQELRQHKLIDYTDLVALPALQAKKDRNSISLYLDHFEHILVDEYQDVTHVLVEFVRQMSQNAKSVWVVGDVRQAIHHWRGASIKSLVKFGAAFSGASTGSVSSYSLERNRRSTPEIVELFSHAGRAHVLQGELPLKPMVASRPSLNFTPRLFPCGSTLTQSQTLGKAVDQLVRRGVDYRDQAVISRKTAAVEQAARDLQSHGIPCLYIGDVYQRPEIKRLICLMQLLCNRQPRALIGLIQEAWCSMPEADMTLLVNGTAPGEGVAWQRGKWLGQAITGLSAQGQHVSNNLAQLLRGMNRHTNPWEFVSTILLDRKYGVPSLSDQTIEASTARLALWLFVHAVRNGDGSPTEARLSQFLVREELRRRIGERLGDRGLPPEARALDAVSVMTVHGSKGLEFRAVHITDVEKDSYGEEDPWDRDARKMLLIPPEVLNSTRTEHEFEEKVERNNLLYVALSRAKDYLLLYEVDQRDRPKALQGAGAFLIEQPVAAAPTPVVQSLPLVNSSGVQVVDYNAFDTYISCPLHYHYRYELSLTADQEIDVSIRARWAVMSSLENYLVGTSLSVALDQAWLAARLPEKLEDPRLYADAERAARRGEEIIQDKHAVIVTGLVAHVEGVQIQLPWMLEVQGVKGAELHWLRIQSKIDTTQRHLQPMFNAMAGRTYTQGAVHSLLTEKSIEARKSYKPSLTAVHKMAKRFVAGDRSPNHGWMCNRCAYMSICDNRP